MGQIFHACAFNASDKTCCVIDADKFHANCFSSSGVVAVMHNLLRQMPYHVMWGGNYVIDEDYLAKDSKPEYLLGLSTFLKYEDFEMSIEELEEKPYCDKVKFIYENNKFWKKLNVNEIWEETQKYFDWSNNYSVKYSGYLLNHTQKLAVNLADYYEQSKSFTREGDAFAIDAIPTLTETGEGAQMAFYDGISADSTLELVGKWCADLLQITDELPENYNLINCCFADIWGRVRYCFRTFGANEDNLVVCDNASKPLEVAALSILGKRGSPQNVKIERTDKGVTYVTEPVSNL